MLIAILKQLKIAFMFLLFFTLLTGMIYPAIVTGFAHVLFPWESQGSLIEVQPKKIGSALIGQSFTTPRYFWGRPSATLPFPNQAKHSSGPWVTLSHPNFLMAVKNRISTLQLADPKNKALIPVDLVTASGSGLDPDISPLAAFYQVSRVAKAREIPEEKIKILIHSLIQNPSFGLLGEPRVNVLALNMALDKEFPHDGRTP